MSDAGGNNSATWSAFLLTAFGVVGVVSCYAIFAAQIPMERALSRDAAMVALLSAPDNATRNNLRDQLGAYADPLISADGAVKASDLKQEIASDRDLNWHAMGVESENIGNRLRWEIAIFAAACSGFGLMILSVAQREGRK